MSCYVLAAILIIILGFILANGMLLGWLSTLFILASYILMAYAMSLADPLSKDQSLLRTTWGIQIFFHVVWMILLFSTGDYLRAHYASLLALAFAIGVFLQLLFIRDQAAWFYSFYLLYSLFIVWFTGKHAYVDLD